MTSAGKCKDPLDPLDPFGPVGPLGAVVVGVTLCFLLGSGAQGKSHVMPWQDNGDPVEEQGLHVGYCGDVSGSHRSASCLYLAD